MGLRLLTLLSTILFISCHSEEYHLNKSRDDIGKGIPVGQKATVNSMTAEPFYDGEMVYRITYKLENDSIIGGVLSSYDYNLLKVGDTLSSQSASPNCFKWYGKPCDEADNDRIRYILLFIFVALPLTLFFTFFEDIFPSFRYTYVGQIIYNVQDFINRIINVYYGYRIFVLVIMIATVLIALVIFGFQSSFGHPFYFLETLILNGKILGGWLLVASIWGGLKNASKNIMVIALGIICVCLLTLMYNILFGMSFSEMIKTMFSESVNR